MSDLLRAERLEALYAEALKAAENAYAPYSNFRVGAAVLLTDGRVVTGTNVENVSYGLTVCAERSAIARAVIESGPKIRVAAVAVANLNGASCPPCGMCRQVLKEFMDADGDVLFPFEGAMKRARLDEILPFAFDADLKTTEPRG